jgi:hypothetical protein
MMLLLPAATGKDIKVIDTLSYDEFVKTFPDGTPPHILEDLGNDMYKVLDKYGCKYPSGGNIRPKRRTVLI